MSTSMSTTQSLTILLGQAERQRDAAIAEHQRAQTASDAAATQADQLRAYRKDYELRWSAQFCREGKIELVRCYQSFMERLTQAVDQQAQVAAHSLTQTERALIVVREAELRCASVRKLIERRTLEVRLDAERRDQKQNDEMASRALWNRLGSSDPRRLN
jgi:flagellar FliJ protein